MKTYDKMNKKEKKEFDKKFRLTWHIKPYTRVVPNGKAYNRAKFKRGE